MAGRQIRRGTNAERVALGGLSVGEFGLETDTRSLYIGSSVGDIRVHGDYITPEMYGAKGDGDPDTGLGTDDTTAVQAAWDAIKNVGGAMFLSKFYRITASLDFSRGDSATGFSVVIQGAGRKKSGFTGVNVSSYLDTGGTNQLILSDFGIYEQGTTAKVAIARYRVLDDADGQGHFHKYYRLHVSGAFDTAILYSCMSEVNSHYECEFINTGTGACYGTSTSNYASLSLKQTPRVTGSNTVNNFYGGMMWNTSTGCAVFFPSGIADNNNFDGTYFVSSTPGCIIKMGVDDADSIQGQKCFRGCRFEGTGDVFKVTGNQVWGLKITECHFGETGAAQDINWTTTSPTSGLMNSQIYGNWHQDQGLTIPLITGSVISVPGNSPYHGNTLTVNGAIANSVVEIDHLTLGGAAAVYASTIIQNDFNAGVLRYKYGPSSGTSAGNAQGSVIVNQPFGAAPTGALVGTIATANITNWDPTAQTPTTPIPVFYDGVNWRPMVVYDQMCPTFDDVTITGVTTIGADALIKRAVDNGDLWITGGNAWNSGARINLSGGTAGSPNLMTLTVSGISINASSGHNGDIAVAKDGGGTRTLHFVHGICTGYTDS